MLPHSHAGGTVDSGHWRKYFIRGHWAADHILQDPLALLILTLVVEGEHRVRESVGPLAHVRYVETRRLRFLLPQLTRLELMRSDVGGRGLVHLQVTLRHVVSAAPYHMRFVIVACPSLVLRCDIGLHFGRLHASRTEQSHLRSNIPLLQPLFVQQFKDGWPDLLLVVGLALASDVL